jgi:hypothetical protein
MRSQVTVDQLYQPEDIKCTPGFGRHVRVPAVLGKSLTPKRYTKLIALSLETKLFLKGHNRHIITIPGKLAQ